MSDALEHVSMDQVLGIWSELWQAYYGKNGFGGDTAEIYAYRLIPYNPSAVVFDSKTMMGKQAREEQAKMAGAALYRIIQRFCRDNGCKVKVNDGSPWHLLKGFEHRVHVKVIR